MCGLLLFASLVGPCFHLVLHPVLWKRTPSVALVMEPCPGQNQEAPFIPLVKAIGSVVGLQLNPVYISDFQDFC